MYIVIFVFDMFMYFLVFSNMLMYFFETNHMKSYEILHYSGHHSPVTMVVQHYFGFLDIQLGRCSAVSNPSNINTGRLN